MSKFETKTLFFSEILSSIDIARPTFKGEATSIKDEIRNAKNTEEIMLRSRPEWRNKVSVKPFGQRQLEYIVLSQLRNTCRDIVGTFIQKYLESILFRAGPKDKIPHLTIAIRALANRGTDMARY